MSKKAAVIAASIAAALVLQVVPAPDRGVSVSQHVSAPTLQIDAPAVAVGTYPYKATASVWNGRAPYLFEVVDGQLPDGLVLNAGTGVVEGRPASAGLSPVVLRMTDAAGSRASAVLMIDVLPSSHGRLAASE